MNYEERLEWFSKRNELLENEIERLNGHINFIEPLWKECIDENENLTNENERLHSIIKEVREKIENTKFAFDFDKEINKLAFDLTYTKQGQELLEILDKE